MARPLSSGGLPRGALARKHDGVTEEVTPMERNAVQQQRLANPPDGLAASKAAMKEPPPPRENRNAIGEGIMGSYVRNQDRPHVGDDMVPPIPRP